MNCIDNKIKNGVIEISKKSVFLRRIIRNSINLLRRIRYWWNTKDIVVDEKTIVFNSFNGKSYSCTPKAIYEYLLTCEKFQDYQFIWVFRNKCSYDYLLKNSNTILVENRSKEYEKALANAKYWIFNYRIYDYIVPRKNQIYVQCWHGTPLKRLGYDIQNSNNSMNSKREIQQKYRTDAKKFTYILSPSAFATDKFSSAWNLIKTGQSDKIVELGYPRDDYLYNYLDGEIQRIKNKLNLPVGKKVMLYAPTWRDNQHKTGVGYVYKSPLKFDELKKELEDEWVILFRAHYLVANAVDYQEYKDFVFDVSRYDDINELYIISDLLVTDYSSVFFDYANLKRPIVFYMYDFKTYKDELRGFYIDLSELPGPIVENEKELIEKIRWQSKWINSYSTKYSSFNKKYNYLNDGKASERFVEKIICNNS